MSRNRARKLARARVVPAAVQAARLALVFDAHTGPDGTCPLDDGLITDCARAARCSPPEARAALFSMAATATAPGGYHAQWQLTPAGPALMFKTTPMETR